MKKIVVFKAGIKSNTPGTYDRVANWAKEEAISLPENMHVLGQTIGQDKENGTKLLQGLFNKTNNPLNITWYGDGTHGNPARSELKYNLWAPRGERGEPLSTFIISNPADESASSSEADNKVAGLVNIGANSIKNTSDQENPLGFVELGIFFADDATDNSSKAKALADVMHIEKQLWGAGFFEQFSSKVVATFCRSHPWANEVAAEAGFGKVENVQGLEEIFGGDRPDFTVLKDSESFEEVGNDGKFYGFARTAYGQYAKKGDQFVEIKKDKPAQKVTAKILTEEEVLEITERATAANKVNPLSGDLPQLDDTFTPLEDGTYQRLNGIATRFVIRENKDGLLDLYEAESNINGKEVLRAVDLYTYDLAEVSSLGEVSGAADDF